MCNSRRRQMTDREFLFWLQGFLAGQTELGPTAMAKIEDKLQDVIDTGNKKPVVYRDSSIGPPWIGEEAPDTTRKL